MTDEDDDVQATEIVVKCEEKDNSEKLSNQNFPLLPPLAPPQNGGFPLPPFHPSGHGGGGHHTPQQHPHHPHPPPSILNSSEDLQPMLRPPLPFLHPAFMSKMNPGLPTSVYETIAASWRR